MIKPDSLKPGDKVGIVAPGKKVSPGDLQPALQALQDWGLRLTLAPNLFSNDHSYLASTDIKRREDLQAMIDDVEIKAIFCARGGYGTTRIIDDINVQPLLENPKWVVGFSDITALHLRLFQSGIESIHGTMPLLFSGETAGASVESLRALLFGSENPIAAIAHKKNKPGKAVGQIVGGNLSLLVDALSTKDDVDLQGKILVIEEIDELLYKIDRMLIHLKRSNKLQHLAGLVVGYMTDPQDSRPGFGETVEDIILSKVSEFKYPIAFNFAFGHENPNLAWRHGSTMQLVVDANGAVLQPTSTVI